MDNFIADAPILDVNKIPLKMPLPVHVASIRKLWFWHALLTFWLLFVVIGIVNLPEMIWESLNPGTDIHETAVHYAMKDGADSIL
jgi:hypothetical protein